MNIAIINGPNLNLLGKREPHIYGSLRFEDYFADLQAAYSDKAVLHYFQSNTEGEIINELHRIGFEYQGILLNAGALTHTSIAIADAIAAISCPVIEVHISNVYAREAFRHHSYLAPNCVGCISGLGLEGYRLGLQYFINQAKTR